MEQKKLFIPGPVDVRPEVLEAMNTPMIGHRSQDASELQKRISEKLQKVFFTQNQILLSTSSGLGLMEAGMRSLTTKRVAVFSVGAFGNKWADIAKRNNIPYDLIEVDWGDPITPELVDEHLSSGKYDAFTIQHNETSTGVTNPLNKISAVKQKYPDVYWLVDAVSAAAGIKAEVDNWGIDFYLTSTQKALGLPPGFSIAAVSERAFKHAEEVEFRGRYFDILLIKKYIDKKPYQYVSTPSLPHMFALDKQLDYILNEEGLENRFARHKELRDLTHKWVMENGFEFFAKEGYRSATVTAVKNNRNISVLDLKKQMADRGYVMAPGYGKLKTDTFRIAHMADRTVKELVEYLDTLSQEIEKL
ncbi:MAG: alanine--glyoxylate aminotransferase family protein [Candidatus Marinimicrobia bacterium]|nr:alanine--glyoxylate aminotransferase family protein [Candidatus Neomarinimicrobiota bacterium]